MAGDVPPGDASGDVIRASGENLQKKAYRHVVFEITIVWNSQKKVLHLLGAVYTCEDVSGHGKSYRLITIKVHHV